MSGIGEIEFVFLVLLLFIVIFGLLAQKLGTPYPIVMVLGGLLLGFIPGIPSVALNPDLVFLSCSRRCSPPPPGPPPGATSTTTSSASFFSPSAWSDSPSSVSPSSPPASSP